MEKLSSIALLVHDERDNSLTFTWTYPTHIPSENVIRRVQHHYHHNHPNATFEYYQNCDSSKQQDNETEILWNYTLFGEGEWENMCILLVSGEFQPSKYESLLKLFQKQLKNNQVKSSNKKNSLYTIDPTPILEVFLSVFGVGKYATFRSNEFESEHRARLACMHHLRTHVTFTNHHQDNQTNNNQTNNDNNWLVLFLAVLLKKRIIIRPCGDNSSSFGKSTSGDISSSGKSTSGNDILPSSLAVALSCFAWHRSSTWTTQIDTSFLGLNNVASHIIVSETLMDGDVMLQMKPHNELYISTKSTLPIQSTLVQSSKDLFLEKDTEQFIGMLKNTVDQWLKLNADDQSNEDARFISELLQVEKKDKL